MKRTYNKRVKAEQWKPKPMGPPDDTSGSTLRDHVGRSAQHGESVQSNQ